MLLIKTLSYRLRASIILYTHVCRLYKKNNNEANQFIIMKNVYILFGNFECHWHIMVKSSNGHINARFPNTFLDIVCRVRITFTICYAFSYKGIYL